jgi:hypothetical protein
VASSTDGANFTVSRAEDPGGPGRAIYSNDQGISWTAPQHVTDQLLAPADRFNHWLAADPVTGDVNVSFYDSRNDTTGSQYMTDIYLASPPTAPLPGRCPIRA